MVGFVSLTFLYEIHFAEIFYVVSTMAGHGVEDDPSLKGLSRYFNSQTNRGRANVSFLSSLKN